MAAAAAAAAAVVVIVFSLQDAASGSQDAASGGGKARSHTARPRSVPAVGTRQRYVYRCMRSDGHHGEWGLDGIGQDCRVGPGWVGNAWGRGLSRVGLV